MKDQGDGKLNLAAVYFATCPVIEAEFVLVSLQHRLSVFILDFTHNQDIAGVNLKRDGQETSTLVSRENLKAENKKKTSILSCCKDMFVD